MSHKTSGYASDLTDKQWKLIKPLIPMHKWGRPRKLDMRGVVNAIFYVVKTGCQWAMLPKEYPNYNSVYYYFRCWGREGVWDRINQVLRKRVRRIAGRQAQPSAGSIDSQSVKTTAIGGQARGIDGNKRVKGRKRHILVDTMGFILKVLVTAANCADGKAAIQLLQRLPKSILKHLKRLWADGSYRGEFASYIAKYFTTIVLDITLPADNQSGFEVIPWRWVVERTFAWLNHSRRLSKDYEFTCLSSQSMIYTASIRLLLRRLSPSS